MKSFKMPSLTVTEAENLEGPDSMEFPSGFLPSIFKTTSSSESDMEALSGSLSPTTRRGSRGSSLTSSPVKLPTIDRSNSNSVSSVVSLTSTVSSRRQRRSDLCRSPSCPQLWLESGDAPELMSARELTKFALSNTHRSGDLALTLPDIRNKKEVKQAKYLAMKREQWLEKQSRKRNSGGTPRKSTNGDVADLMISPRNKIQNPILLPLDAIQNKENDTKKGKKKKLKVNKLDKTDSKKTLKSESIANPQELHVSKCEAENLDTQENSATANEKNVLRKSSDQLEDNHAFTAQISSAQNDSVSSDRASKSDTAAQNSKGNYVTEKGNASTK